MIHDMVHVIGSSVPKRPGERTARPKRQRGYILAEYVLVTAILVAALFLPVPTLGTSVVDWLLDAIRGFQANSTYLLSLP